MKRFGHRAKVLALALALSLFAGALMGCSCSALDTTEEAARAGDVAQDGAAAKGEDGAKSQESADAQESDDESAGAAPKASGEGASASSDSRQGSGGVGQGSANTGAGGSKPASPPKETPKPAPATITVNVTVDSSRASYQGYPACMASTSVTLAEGATVYDALLAAGVSVGGSSEYVRSINGLSEFACGDLSGWLYSVDGSIASISCGSYRLYGGENVVWHYTCNMGKDL